MITRKEPQTMTDPSIGKNILTSENFRVDHPFRATRQIFGPSVLDIEGPPHVQRKRVWLKQFDRHWVASPECQTMIEAAIATGFERGYCENDLFLACKYIPNKVILDLLGIEKIDPIEHFQNIRPVIEYLEIMKKSPDLPAARDYLHSLIEMSETSLFADFQSEDRNHELMLLAVAGSETTVVALKSAMTYWATDELHFRANIGQQGREGFVASLLRADPPLGLATRYCVSDTLLAGRSIQRGDIVHVSIVDANSTPEPCKKADIGHSAGRELTFGAGKHYCPGHLLAKAEMYAFVDKLVTLNSSEFEIKYPDQADRPKTFRHPPHLAVCPQRASSEI